MDGEHNESEEKMKYHGAGPGEVSFQVVSLTALNCANISTAGLSALQS